MLHFVGFLLLDEADSFNQYKLLKMLIATLSGSNQSLLNRDANIVEKVPSSLRGNPVVHEKMELVLTAVYTGMQRGSWACLSSTCCTGILPFVWEEEKDLRRILRGFLKSV